MDSEKSKKSSTDKKSKSGSSKSSDPIGSTVRLQRNQAEKQRRDRLNGYISELANIVPMVKNSSKPVDKVSVLRLAAAHMRLNFSCLNPKKFNSSVPVLPASIISYLEIVEKNIGGFIIVTTFSGTVLFCSKCVEDFVGYQSIDIIGQSIYNYVDSKEVSFFEKKVNSAISRKKNVPKVVKLHMQQRPLPRSTEIKYRKMLFKLSVHCNDTVDDSSPESKSVQKVKKVKHKDFGASSVILMFIEPMQMEPKINKAYLLTHQDIYFTIHGLQGEIMYADQRIATITGYMPQDVKGTSAYQYILEHDVPIALFAQQAMFTSNNGTGLITYRLRIFDSSYIYLQSKGQIVYKDNSTERSHFVCYNRWLSEEEGSTELKKFQERFAPQITDSKAADILQGFSNKQPSPSKASQEEDKDATCSFGTLNDCHIEEQTSISTYSGNLKYNQISQNATISSESSIQPSEGYAQCNIGNMTNFSDDIIMKDYSTESCLSDLNSFNKEFEYDLGEVASQSSSAIQATHHQPVNSHNSGLGFAELGFLEQEVLNGLSESKQFSVELLDNNYSPLELQKFPNLSVNSDHGSIELANEELEISIENPSLTNKLSLVAQSYDSCRQPVNGFGISEGKLPIAVNVDAGKRDQPYLNGFVKLNGNPLKLSNGFCNGTYAMPKYESNGHYNMDSSYATSQSSIAINEHDDYFAGLNGSSYTNGAHLDYLSFLKTNFEDSPSNCNNSEFAIPNGHSIKDPYAHTNGFHDSTFSMGNGYTEVIQKQNTVSMNKSGSNTNGAHLNLYDIPPKRLKTDLSYKNGDNRNGSVHFSLLDNANCQEFHSSETDSKKIGSYPQNRKVRESPSIEIAADGVRLNGDLYDELDMFFQHLPLSTFTPQSQRSHALAQSADSEQSQVKLAARNVSS